MICKCGHKEKYHNLQDYGRVWICLSCWDTPNALHKFQADNLRYLEYCVENLKS